MLIILPNKCKGLAKLEKLADTLDFSTINKYLSYDSVVEVTMPKFKIQFETSLINPLANVCQKIIFSYCRSNCKTFLLHFFSFSSLIKDGFWHYV